MKYGWMYIYLLLIKVGLVPCALIGASSVYIDIQLDNTYTESTKDALRAVMLYAAQAAYNATDLHNIVCEYESCIANITILRLANNTTKVSVDAPRICACINEHDILLHNPFTEKTYITESTHFIPDAYNTMPRLHVVSETCSPKDLLQVSEWYGKTCSMTHDLYIDGPHELLLVPRSSMRWSIRCSIDSLPTAKELEDYQVLIEKMAATNTKKKQRSYILLDRRFASQLIVRTIQGEHSWQEFFKQNQLPQST